MKLDIPHVSQRGEGADFSSNDCGPAVLTMAIRYLAGATVDVDAVGRACGQVKDKTTQFWQLQNGLRHFGIDSTIRNELQPNGRIYPDEMRTVLNGGSPIVLVVWYPYLTYRKQVDYKGWHFVLAVGHDEVGIFVHDPLFGEAWQARGTFIHVADNELKRAQVGNGKNLPYQGLIIHAPAPPAPAETPGVDEATGAALTAELIRLSDEAERWEKLYRRERQLRLRLETAVQNALGALRVVADGHNGMDEAD